MMQGSSLFFVFGAIVSIQFGAALAKELFSELGAMSVAGLRLLFAALILISIFRPWRAHLGGTQLRAVVGYGICLGAMNLLFYLSLERIPLGIAVALEFVGPLGVAIFYSKRGLDFLWGLLAASGIILLLPIHSLSNPLDGVGVLLALGAGLCWGFYIIAGAKASALVKESVAASLGMTFAAFVVLPFGLYELPFRSLTQTLLLKGVMIAILSSALPYTLEMFALKRIAAKTFGILMSLEPAVAALFGYLYLSETLSGLQGVAILCIISASLGSSLAGRPKKVPVA